MTRQIRFNAFDMNCVGHQSPGLWAHPRDRSWQYKDLNTGRSLGSRSSAVFLTASLLPTSSAITTSTRAAIIMRCTRQPKFRSTILCNSSRRSPWRRSIWVLGSRRQRPSSILIHLPGVSRLRIITPKAASAGTSSLPISRAAPRISVRAVCAATTTDTRSPRNMSKSSTSCSRAAGRRAPSFVTARSASSPIPTRCMRSVTRGNTSKFPVITYVSRRRNARRCSTRPAHRDRENRLPPGMRSAFSLPRPPKEVLEEATWAKSCARPRSRAATRASSTPIIFARSSSMRRTPRHKAKFDEYRQYASYDGALVFMSGWSGSTSVDTRRRRRQEGADERHYLGGRSSGRRRPRLDDQGACALGWHWRSWTRFVGSPTTIADILQEWTEETDVDGYNLAYAVTHETFEDVEQYVVFFFFVLLRDDVLLSSQIPIEAK